jgi:hypothetical protein
MSQQSGVDLCLPGRYSLANRRDMKGNRREFACRTTRVSPFQMKVDVPVIGSKGERVISYFGEFGKLDGFITDIFDGGFLFELAVTRARREMLANKMTWLDKRQKDPAMRDARTQDRIVPESPHSTLIFADGSALGCFVIDMSASGAAVSADVQPEVGTPLAVGASVGRVVRHFREGFAVRFAQQQDVSRLPQLIIRP